METPLVQDQTADMGAALTQPVAEVLDSSRPRRFGLDLRPWAEDSWPAFALVTVLPARLPGTYGRFELLSFIGLGGMGQVWMAECPDYRDHRVVHRITHGRQMRQTPCLL